jgi:hypothetical protein
MPIIAPHEFSVSDAYEKERANALRAEWRMVALLQWFRGWRLVALLVALIAYPALLYYLDSATGLMRLSSSIAEAFGILALAPLVTVVFTLLALDGPGGLKRANILRTVPGASAQWVRALIFSARICAYTVIVVWEFAGLNPERDLPVDTLALILGYPLLIVWTIPLIVTATRLAVSVPVLASVLLWALSMWPGLLILYGELECIRHRCGVPDVQLYFAIPFGYLLQGRIARSCLQNSLRVLFNASI